MKNSKYLVISALALLLGTPTVFAATEIRIFSEDGDRIGQGQSRLLTNLNGAITVVGGQANDIEVQWVDGASDYYNLRFRSADGLLPLEVGVYENAERWVPGSPTLDIWSFNGGCNRVEGRFEIHELEFDQNGIATRFAVDAIQHCEGDARRLMAQVRIDSDIPFDLGPQVRTGADQQTSPNTPVDIGLDLATTTNGAIESYAWQQTFGLPVNATGSNTDTVSFTTPSSDSEFEIVEFEVQIADTAGETAADSVTVVSTDSPVSQSVYRIVPGQGSYIGGDQAVEAIIDTQYLTVVRDGVGVQIDYAPPDNSGWTMSLAPPKDRELHLGQYDDAYSTNKRAFNKPGIAFELAGRPCSDYVGEFKILDLGLAANLAVTRLAVDALIACVENPIPIDVRVRIDSASPLSSRAPVADPGPDQTVHSGDVVSLNASATQNDTGAIATFEWQQLSGPTVNVNNASSSLASFTAPEVAQGTGRSEFQLTVSNDSGFSDSETVVVNILGADDPKSYVRLRVEPGRGIDSVTLSSDIDVRLDSNTGHLVASKDDAATKAFFELNAVDVFRFRFRMDGTEVFPNPGLVPGLYEGAESGQAGKPHFEMSGLGPACGTGYGYFIVHEYLEGADGQPLSMAIDFEHSCDFGPVLYGVIRINSAIPENPAGLFASAGPDIEAVPGQIVRLDSSGSYIGPSAGVSYNWEQISGPPVSIDGANLPNATFLAPGGAGVAVFRVTITTAEGLTHQAIVTVDLLGPGVPLTAMIWQSLPGEILFQGDAKYFSEAEVRDRIYTASEITIRELASQTYTLIMSSADGSTLAPGDYHGAHSYGSVPGFPGVDVAYNFYGCVSAVGWYRIHEISPSADGTTIDNLAVDFWQTCDYGIPPLYGALRINSTVPLRTETPIASAGQDLTGRSGAEIQLSAARSYSWDANITQYSWAQLSGPAATVVSGMNTATPTIELPQTGSPSEQLVFEVTVTNDRGVQASATTTVTVLATDEPWNELNISLYDTSSGEILEVIEATPNFSYFDRLSEATRLNVSVASRHRNMNIDIETQNMPASLTPGLYRIDPVQNTGAPQMNVAGFPGVRCDQQAPGWVHVKEVEQGATFDAIVFESGHTCNENYGVRVSGRFNSATVINKGAPFISSAADRNAVEGDTVFIDDVIGYVEGEVADSVEWQHVSGPAPIVATTFDGPTSFVAPATAGTADTVLRLSVTSATQGSITDDISIRITDNGVTGLPAGLISTRTATGTYQGTGLPVAVDSAHIVELHTLAPGVIASPEEPRVAPFGIFDMVFDTDVAETISVTVHFPQAVATDAVWLQKREGEAWQDFALQWSLAPDRMSLTFELSDDPATDYDFIENGKIRFRGGLGQSTELVAPPPPPPPPPPKSGGGGGGGSTGILALAMLLLIGWLRYAAVNAMAARVTGN